MGSVDREVVLCDGVMVRHVGYGNWHKKIFLPLGLSQISPLKKLDRSKSNDSHLKKIENCLSVDLHFIQIQKCKKKQ